MKVKKGAIVKEAKSAEVQKLKNRIKRLEKDKRELISKLNTLEAAFEKNIKFLKGSTEDVTVEDLIEAAKVNKSLKEVKADNQCPKCGSDELKTIKTLFGELDSCSCGYTNKRVK
jgi:archaellum component FlaC